MMRGRGDRDLQYFFSGSEYGLATFVDGNPGYITTMDGTRWFAGAQVPTGHKIITIGNGRVSFERDGRVEELILGPETPPARPRPTVTGVRSTRRSAVMTNPITSASLGTLAAMGDMGDNDVRDGKSKLVRGALPMPGARRSTRRPTPSPPSPTSSRRVATSRPTSPS